MVVLISDGGKLLLDDGPGGADYKAEKPKQITLEDVVGHYEPETWISYKAFLSLVRNR
jgi:hypothetical protein